MAIETCTYLIPAHWAGYIINGDCSGLSESEAAIVDMVLEEYGELTLENYDQEPFFTKYHDCTQWGVLACDCIEFISM